MQIPSTFFPQQLCHILFRNSYDASVLLIVIVYFTRHQDRIFKLKSCSFNLETTEVNLGSILGILCVLKPSVWILVLAWSLC